jgi:hypothetical protein
LRFTGSADIIISGDLLVTQLHLNNAGNVSVSNALTVSESIAFTNGKLRPVGSGKILFTGSGESVTGGGSTSFVAGKFYQSGGGARFFPIGTADFYAPVSFDNIETPDEVGIAVVNSDPQLTIPATQSDIKSIFTAHYWTVESASPVNSRVNVDISRISLPTSDLSYAVVESTGPSGEANNLGFVSQGDTQITSRQPLTGALIAIGFVNEIVVLVRDLITPFSSPGDNDKLTIEKIESFDHNTVTLLDRWGVVVKSWKDYSNDIDYDFSLLSPGNYIVVVEYGNATEGSHMQKVSQMVTVLKTN